MKDIEDVEENKLQIQIGSSGEDNEDLLVQYLFQLPFSIAFYTAGTGELKTNSRLFHSQNTKCVLDSTIKCTLET